MSHRFWIFAKRITKLTVNSISGILETKNIQSSVVELFFGFNIKNSALK